MWQELCKLRVCLWSLDKSLLESAQRGQGGIQLGKFSLRMLVMAQAGSMWPFCLWSLCSGILHRQGMLCWGEQLWVPCRSADSLGGWTKQQQVHFAWVLP